MISGFVHPKPQPTHTETDFRCCDVDNILVKSQTILTKLTQAQNTITLIIALAKTESAIDGNQFLLTSGLTESVGHLSELETISNSSLQVVNVRSILEIVLQAALFYNKNNTHSISIHLSISLIMPPSVLSQMLLRISIPDRLNLPLYANMVAYAIPRNDNGF